MTTAGQRAGGRPIALIGLRCSGKTSVGRRLAELAGCPFVDLDESIVDLVRETQELGELCRVGDVLAAVGVEGFRVHEALALQRALQAPPPWVLATGGGVVEVESNRELLRSRAWPVWLDVPVPILQQRLRADEAPRPALVGKDAADELPFLSSRRRLYYHQTARLTLECGEDSVETLARRLLEGLLGSRGGA